MNNHDDKLITIDTYEETWHRDIKKIVDDDGTIKEIIPDTTVAYSFTVLGNVSDIRRFQELITEFVFNHPDVVVPQHNQDDD